MLLLKLNVTTYTVFFFIFYNLIFCNYLRSKNEKKKKVKISIWNKNGLTIIINLLWVVVSLSLKKVNIILLIGRWYKVYKRKVQNYKALEFMC